MSSMGVHVLVTLSPLRYYPKEIAYSMFTLLTLNACLDKQAPQRENIMQQVACVYWIAPQWMLLPVRSKHAFTWNSYPRKKWSCGMYLLDTSDLCKCMDSCSSLKKTVQKLAVWLSRFGRATLQDKYTYARASKSVVTFIHKCVFFGKYSYGQLNLLYNKNTLVGCPGYAWCQSCMGGMAWVEKLDRCWL